MTALRLRTAAWSGDEEIELAVPGGGAVTVHTPQTPPPLSDDAIDAALRMPVAQEPVSRLAAGARRPLIIVDDLTRPTPADRIVPALLRQLAEAGIAAGDVTILLATGTHQDTPPDAVARKVGPEAAAACRLLVHDDHGELVKVGRTSFGTPVHVDRAVVESDYVLGVGGVYPQHSTGFGGGSKLAIGVLGRASIARLHYRHPSAQGSYDTDNDFRRDLDEIADLIGLRTSVSAHVDTDRQIVRVVCGGRPWVGAHVDRAGQMVRVVGGDHRRYYADAVAFALETYRTPLPGDADVVISNAYPIDVSLTFMRSKGIIPLLHAAPGASRVLVSACPEGLGHHGLFPFVPNPGRWRYRHMARRARAPPGVLPPGRAPPPPRPPAAPRGCCAGARRPLHRLRPPRPSRGRSGCTPRAARRASCPSTCRGWPPSTRGPTSSSASATSRAGATTCAWP